MIRVSEKTYCYEETRITPTEDITGPTVHTILYRLKDFDLDEKLDSQEIQLRGLFRPIPNVMGFSLYSRRIKGTARSHFSVVENTLNKNVGGTWSEWFQDLKDRRDMSFYLRRRWAFF